MKKASKNKEKDVIARNPFDDLKPVVREKMSKEDILKIRKEKYDKLKNQEIVKK